MNFLSHTRIGTRLAAAFGIVLLLALVATTVGLMNARSQATATREMMEKPLAKERLVSDWYVLMYSAIARTELIARSKDASLPTVFADVIAASSKRGAELMGKVKELVASDEERVMFDKIVVLRTNYQNLKTAVGNARKAGDDAAAEKIFNGEFTPAAQQESLAVGTAVGELRKVQVNAFDAVQRQVHRVGIVGKNHCARQFSGVVLCIVLGGE